MAAPTLNFKIAVTLSGGSTRSITTSATVNDILVVAACASTIGSYVPSVSSVSTTSGSTTAWQKRVARTNSGSDSGQFLGIELWWAKATATGSFTVQTTWSANIDDAVVTVFSVTGCNTSSPWDSNVSLPATQANGTASTTTPSVTVSTTSPDDFVFGFISSGTNSSYGLSGGFTLITNTANSGGTNFCDAFGAYEGLTSTLSGSAIAVNNSAVADWVYVVDALTADTPVSGSFFFPGFA